MSSFSISSGASEREMKKLLRIVRMADADVAVGVDHVLLGEDAVGDDEVLDEGVEVGHDRGSGGMGQCGSYGGTIRDRYSRP